MSPEVLAAALESQLSILPPPSSAKKNTGPLIAPPRTLDLVMLFQSHCKAAAASDDGDDSNNNETEEEEEGKEEQKIIALC